ncbi:RNA polymerase sigma factor [Streptomyces sp. NPDC001502]|uniref:RNA polymerase sigma factor n=1 Tax=Streptomyces sp. NPDC001502 TaxID=3364578 RepID=UPI003680F646
MTAPSKDQRDFTAFVRNEKAEKKLHRYLAKHGVTEHEGEDIAQYALMKLWESWPCTSKPMAFAYHAAKGRWIDLLRYKNRHATSVEYIADLVFEVEDSQDDPAVLAVQKQLVLDFVKTLPKTQKYVFVCTLDGMAPRQIAKELHLGEATVRSHLRHSRQRLRLLLEEDPELGERARHRCEA